MGVAHHTCHLVWFEIGRTELLRSRGCAYAELEGEGVFLPVVEVACRYHRPVGYDEELSVETVVAEVGAARVRFRYRILRPATGELIATGTTLHAAWDGRRRPARLPERIREILKP
ncbi:MAG: acyl-CoA thioesterase [Acidobacteria bacterium]|nr:acyl-CoA thioesterase [Acidobacteriota bacterium]